VDVREQLRVPGEDGLVDDVPHDEENGMVATASPLFSLNGVGVRPEQYDFGGAPAGCVLLQIKKRGQRDAEVKMSGTEGIRGWG
jgi:hypothetical protein